MSRTELNQGAISKTGYIIGGAAVVVIAFAVTLFALNYWAASADVGSPTSSEPTPAAGPPVRQATALNALPKPTTDGLSWIGISGVHAQTVDMAPGVAGQPVLQVIAIPVGQRHELAIEFSRLPIGQAYRLAAWIKPIAGGNFEIEAGDHANSKPSFTFSVFDLADRKVIATDANAKAGIEPGTDGWQKVWVELPTSNGQLFAALYVVKGGTIDFNGDGLIGVTLGGLAAEPKS